MKLYMLYACVITMFLFTATAVAEILPWGSGGTSGAAAVAASHGNEFDYEDNSGDNGYYTTEAGTFSYHCEVWTDIEAQLNLYGYGWGRSTAIARATADYGAESYIYFDIDYSAWYFNTNLPNPVSGSDYFPAYTGVYAEWVVVTACQIEEGTWSDAHANAYAYASASMQ